MSEDFGEAKVRDIGKIIDHFRPTSNGLLTVASRSSDGFNSFVYTASVLCAKAVSK